MNLLGSFWHWWRGELASILPESLKVAFFGGSSALPAQFVPGLSRIRRTRKGYEIPGSLLDRNPPVVPKLKRQRRVDVALPENLILKRQVEAPGKARGKLAALARLDLKRNTPIPEDAAVWVLGSPKPNGQTVSVTQHVAKTSDLTSLRRSLGEIGLNVRNFVVPTSDGKPLPLPDVAMTARGARGWQRLNMVLALGAICTGAYLWLQPAIVAQSRLPVLEGNLHALRSETVALRRALDADAAQRSEAERLQAAMLLRPRLVESLRNVTVSLPDEAWLSAMSFTPETMTLSGETAGTASDLVLGLSQNRQFGNPRLSGPTTRTNAGREKFEIAATPGGSP